MGVVTNLLGNLVGLTGAPNGTRGIQILGTGTLDLASSATVPIYTPPAGNTDLIIVLGAVLRDSNGSPAPPPNGFTTAIVLYVGGVQVGYLSDQGYSAINNPFYTVALGTTSFPPLQPDTAVTGLVVNPQANSELVKVDLIGYTIPA